MRLTLLLSFLLIGLLLNGQSLDKLKNGVSIKGHQYSEKEYNIDFQIFTLDSVTIKVAQIFRKEFNGDDFNCIAIIQTTRKDRIIDELYFDNIEPVGSFYGVCFNERQPSNKFIIGSKYGDYSGQLIIIDNKGKIISYKKLISCRSLPEFLPRFRFSISALLLYNYFLSTIFRHVQ